MGGTERKIGTGNVDSEILFTEPVSFTTFCNRVRVGNPTIVRMSNEGELEVTFDESGKIPEDEANRLATQIREMIDDGRWPSTRRVKRAT